MTVVRTSAPWLHGELPWGHRCQSQVTVVPAQRGTVVDPAYWTEHQEQRGQHNGEREWLPERGLLERGVLDVQFLARADAGVPVARAAAKIPATSVTPYPRTARSAFAQVSVGFFHAGGSC
jgi:hypothetical protein